MILWLIFCMMLYGHWGNKQRNKVWCVWLFPGTYCILQCHLEISPSQFRDLLQYSHQDHMLRCPLYSKSVFITVTKKLQARALGAREHEIACFVVAIIHCNDKQDAPRQRKPTPCLAWGTWNSLVKTPHPPPPKKKSCIEKFNILNNRYLCYL